MTRLPVIPPMIASVAARTWNFCHPRRPGSYRPSSRLMTTPSIPAAV
ncbi:hypothetical protein [Micromonospora sp. NPDC000018]